MRLSDLIKKDPGEEEPKPEKPAAPPADAGSEDAAGEEEPFRLSELPEMKKPGEAPSPAPPPEEERPIEMPDFSGTAPVSSEIAPHPETPASSPLEEPFVEESAPPSSTAPPKRARRSVLMGPDTVRTLDDEPEESRHIEIQDNPFVPLRERSLQFVTAMFQSVNDQTAYPLGEAEDIIYDCIEATEALDHLYSLAVSAKDTTNSLAIHLFNHTVYALKLGRGLRWAEDRMVRLGVASLIHDIGMCRVSQQIRHKEGKLTPEEIGEIHNHCKYGMEIILELYGEPFRWLAEAIYHEHEREDGNGYPQGLAGNQISEYGKVIGLADVYEALTHNRPQRKRLLPHKAVQEIVQTQKTQFHQKLLKIMLEELSVFSLNSLVRLNSNAIGRVVETVQGQPLRPVIQLLFDADGNEIMEERLIALREFPLLYIVDEVEDSELPTAQ